MNNNIKTQIKEYLAPNFEIIPIYDDLDILTQTSTGWGDATDIDPDGMSFDEDDNFGG